MKAEMEKSPLWVVLQRKCRRRLNPYLFFEILNKKKSQQSCLCSFSSAPTWWQMTLCHYKYHIFLITRPVPIRIEGNPNFMHVLHYPCAPSSTLLWAFTECWIVFSDLNGAFYFPKISTLCSGCHNWETSDKGIISSLISLRGAEFVDLGAPGPKV